MFTEEYVLSNVFNYHYATMFKYYYKNWEREN